MCSILAVVAAFLVETENDNDSVDISECTKHPHVVKLDTEHSTTVCLISLV